MKPLPAGKSSCKDLHQILLGPIRADLMMTAIKLDVFNEITEFCSSVEVARSIGTHPDNTRRFL